MSDKVCHECGISKPFSEFYREPSRKRKGGVKGPCKRCRLARAKLSPSYKSPKRRATQLAWRRANAEHLRAKDAKRRLTKRAQCMIAAARLRAKKRGIAFDLDGCADILQARIDRGVCEFSGIRLDLSPGRKIESPSLDRINPKLGYVLSNVRIVCFGINVALNDWGEAGLMRMVNAIARHERNRSRAA